MIGSFSSSALTRLNDSKLIGMAINSGKWIQVDEFSPPLRKRENPIVQMKGEKYQNLMEDTNGDLYSLFIGKFGNKFELIVTDKDMKCRFSRADRSVVRIQPLTDSEAEKAHFVANPIFDVYHV